MSDDQGQPLVCPVCGLPVRLYNYGSPYYSASCACVTLVLYDSREQAAAAWREWDAKRREVKG